MVKIKFNSPTVKQISFKGTVLVDGNTYDLSDVLASRLVAAHPDLVTVLEGKPAPVSAQSVSVKEAARTAREREQEFPTDPKAVLADFPAIPQEIRSLKVAEVKDGKADDYLPWLALWAKLAGKEDLVLACVERQVALVLAGG